MELPTKSPLILTIKTRRSQKIQEKSFQRSKFGFRLNPYYEQKDFSCLKPKGKIEHSTNSCCQTLKKARGRPPKTQQQISSESSKSILFFIRKI